MIQRTWSMPLVEPPENQANNSADASDASPPSGQTAGRYLHRFLGAVICWSIVSAFFVSLLPLGIGMFFFFTDDAFIAWALGKTGIRLVPNSVGTNFVNGFVFICGFVLVTTHWRASLPAWAAPPPGLPPWYVLVGAGIFFAALKTFTTAAVRKALPRVGIALQPDSLSWSIAEALIAAIVFGLLALLVYGSGLNEWLNAH